MFTKIQSYAAIFLVLMLTFIVQQALVAARYLQELRLSFKAKLALLFAPLAVIPSLSWADVPASVTAGITSAVSDVGSIGALVMGVIIAIVAFTWLKRVLSGK